MIYLALYFLALGIVLGLATFIRYNDLSYRKRTLRESILLSAALGVAVSDIGTAVLIYIHLT